MTDGTELRRTFDRVAELYHAIRPRYPSALFDTLVQETRLPPRARVVEIGPGTGQATQPLARRGFDITAIELGGELAEIARRELRRYPNVRVITGAFEDVELPDHAFDLILAATALHWIAPGARFAKPHRLLKPSGRLAIIHTRHVSDERGDTYFHASQAVYDRYYPRGDRDAPTLPAAEDVHAAELDSALFRMTAFERFPIEVEYTAVEYAQLLNTYSPTLALPEDQRRGFLADIATVIERELGGRFTKRLVMSLTVAEPLGL
jgi:SAM-dependent methyltransferase